MKNAFLIVVGCLVLAACSSKNNVTPTVDAGNVVAGTYPLSYVRQDSAGIKLYEFNLPYTVGTNSLSGSITARRDSASVLFLTQTINQTGYTAQTSVIGSVRLQAVGSSYDMCLSGQRIGTIDGTTLSIDEQQTDPATKTIYRLILTGRK